MEGHALRWTRSVFMSVFVGCVVQSSVSAEGRTGQQVSILNLCWFGKLTFQTCCDRSLFGPKGNPLCWGYDPQFTYESCCEAEVDAMPTSDDLWQSLPYYIRKQLRLHGFLRHHVHVAEVDCVDHLHANSQSEHHQVAQQQMNMVVKFVPKFLPGGAPSGWMNEVTLHGALSRHKYANIIHIYHYTETVLLKDGIDLGYAVLFMEEGKANLRNLLEFLQEKPNNAFRDLLLARVFLGITSAVASLHDNAWVHRDLKLENVFLSDEPRFCFRHPHRCFAKLSDFETACNTNLGTCENTWAPPGTSMYVSPEGFETRVSQASDDMWSLGVMLHELVHDGQYPTGNWIDKMQKVKHEYIEGRGACGQDCQMRPNLQELKAFRYNRSRASLGGCLHSACWDLLDNLLLPAGQRFTARMAHARALEWLQDAVEQVARNSNFSTEELRKSSYLDDLQPEAPFPWC